MSDIDWNIYCECEKCLSIHAKADKRHDPNPWRYPSRGELPERETFYLISAGHCGIAICYWRSGKWYGAYGPAWDDGEVRAWRELPEPAPKLEDE